MQSRNPFRWSPVAYCFWKLEMVPLSDLIYDGPQPLHEHLVELIGATKRGARKPDVRVVPVRNLVTRDEDVRPDFLALYFEDPPPPSEGLIFVVEIARRRYWAFDDTHSVRAWQQVTPDLMVRVDVLQTYASSGAKET
jgi:hypothetical protein